MNKTTAIVFFGIILLGLVISLVTLNTCSKPVQLGENETNVPSPESPGTDQNQTKAKSKDEVEKPAVKPATELELGFASPEAAMKALSRVLGKRDFQALKALVGAEALPQSIRPKVRSIVQNPDFNLSASKPFTEISKSADSARWALNFDSDDVEKVAELYADLTEIEGGKIVISGIRLPMEIADVGPSTPLGPGNKISSDHSDALAIVHAFALAVVQRDFETARALSDLESVTDERVAALIIAIEEGNFTLKEDRPFVVTLAREDITWVLSRLQSDSGASEFAVELGQFDGNWKVSGLTFSKVLSALAQAAGGGGLAYSPIVEDPAGGDSLVLYFEFDETNLTSRGNRQLAIVADILSQGEDRVIQINGHADALGSDNYNAKLSNQRADAIREALISMGVSSNQVVTEGFGESKPRRPNFNPDGSDNPTGRSENRRAEVYLDF
jgi:outer membrane protein OmpA-like peptidoglycan-associated protein